WYLGIARDGYGALHTTTMSRWAFFPGLPTVIKVAGWLGAQRLLPLVLNELAFLVALAGIHVLARRRGSERAASLAGWSGALFPASVVFSMMYPSSLFLAVSVWAFVLVEDGRVIGAGVLAAAATMLRPNGIVVAVALFFAFFSKADDSALPERWRRAVVACGPSVIALAAWCWY